MNWLCLVIGFAVGLLVGEFVLMLAMMFFSGTGGGSDERDAEKLSQLEMNVAWLMDTVEDLEPVEDGCGDYDFDEESNILPCPYCGGTNIGKKDEYGYSKMVCGFCHAQTFGTDETLNNPPAALKLWNLGGTNIMCPSTDLEGQNVR